MRFLLVTVFSLSLCSQVMAQDARTRQFIEFVRWEQSLALDAMRNQNTQHLVEQQKQSKMLEMRFIRQANQFVDAWSGFVREFNERGTLNYKAARKASKAFHSLERMDVWPGR